MRVILSQKFIESVRNPTNEEIEHALAKKGLVREDNYSFGNEYISVTDVEGDNVLTDINGEIYFIDPIISFKKPIREIIKQKRMQQNEL